MVMDLYGTDLLKQIQATYQGRFQKALERGFDQEGNPYHWLFAELHTRLQTLREALLYLDALPKFLDTADTDKPYQYLMTFMTRYFSQERIGASEDSGAPNPFFQDENPYWKELQDALDAFNDPDLLRDLPLFFIYSCELITRAVRLYFQIRESKFRAIDRSNFDTVMHSSAACGLTQQAG